MDLDKDFAHEFSHSNSMCENILIADSEKFFKIYDATETQESTVQAYKGYLPDPAEGQEDGKMMHSNMRKC